MSIFKIIVEVKHRLHLSVEFCHKHAATAKHKQQMFDTAAYELRTSTVATIRCIMSHESPKLHMHLLVVSCAAVCNMLWTDATMDKDRPPLLPASRLLIELFDVMRFIKLMLIRADTRACLCLCAEVLSYLTKGGKVVSFFSCSIFCCEA